MKVKIVGNRIAGTILAYSHDAKAGVVITSTGTRYIFELRHWKDSSNPPIAGEAVTFLYYRPGCVRSVERVQ